MNVGRTYLVAVAAGTFTAAVTAAIHIARLADWIVRRRAL